MRGRWASREEQREGGGGRGERAGRDIMSGMGNSAGWPVSGFHPSHSEILDVGWLLRISLF